jgi:hypothetical protein
MERFLIYRIIRRLRQILTKAKRPLPVGQHAAAARKEIILSEIKDQFLAGLHLLLDERGYASDRVARYAYEFYLDHSFDDPRLEHIIDFLKGMDAGPEFELSEEEFKKFLSDNL